MRVSQRTHGEGAGRQWWRRKLESVSWTDLKDAERATGTGQCNSSTAARDCSPRPWRQGGLGSVLCSHWGPCHTVFGEERN